MNGILNFSIHFNVVHRKVDWRKPKMKSLNSMPGRPTRVATSIIYIHLGKKDYYCMLHLAFKIAIFLLKVYQVLKA